MEPMCEHLEKEQLSVLAVDSEDSNTYDDQDIEKQVSIEENQHYEDEYQNAKTDSESVTITEKEIASVTNSPSDVNNQSDKKTEAVNPVNSTLMEEECSQEKSSKGDVSDDEDEWGNIPDAEEDDNECCMSSCLTEENKSEAENYDTKDDTSLSDSPDAQDKPTKSEVQWAKMDFERSSDVEMSKLINIMGDSLTSSSVQIDWPGRSLKEDEWFVIYFKEEGIKRWMSFEKYLKENHATVNVLEPDKTYQFRVKIKDDEEDTITNYSEVSDPIKTPLSLVQIWKGKSTKAKHSDKIWILPAMEVLAARDERHMTRKFVLSFSQERKEYPEKTILVLGATGSGKSTWIDSMANYILGAECEGDRFQIVSLEASEKHREADPTISLTEWITCYTIIPNKATEDRLNFKLNILDTPGVGDTRGISRDEEIIKQIEKLFQKEGEGGIKEIDAICFVFPAPQTRLTASQRYVCETMVALFGKDVSPNIVTITTFCDGQKPNVLKTLEALEIPYRTWFDFNNGGLFEDTSSDEDKEMLRQHWKRNTTNFRKMFEALERLEPKTLQLTVEVLLKRRKMQHTQDTLWDQIKEALDTVWALDQEIDIFIQNKDEIEKNRNFKYSINEVVTEKRKLPANATYQTTNCKVCNYTCHLECPMEKKDIKKCIAMDEKGCCMTCPNSCHYSKHTKSNFILERNHKKVEKSFKGKMSEHNQRGQREKNTEDVIRELKGRVDDYEKRIIGLVSLHQGYDAELQEKALRHNPADVADYFDQLIQAEKAERKQGYKERIQALEKCKKRMDVMESIKEVFDRIKLTGIKLTEAYQKERKGFFGQAWDMITKPFKK